MINPKRICFELDDYFCNSIKSWSMVISNYALISSGHVRE